jgi:L-aspartate oxidase
MSPTSGLAAVDELARADVLIVGAGAAGLTAALGCAAGGGRRVVVLTKTAVSAGGAGGASVWAQGGVASAVGEDDDPALHAADTLAAGAGLNDPRIVSLLTGEGPRRVDSLLALGARFDREPGGRLALGREAAHSRRRILHAHGDATGAEVVRTLVEAVRQEPSIRVVDQAFALDLVRVDGAVAGLVARYADGRLVLYRAAATVLATGGLGQLFLHTTNPREATADGLAMAARAGARLVDLEFVQFHPTALAVPAVGGADAGGQLPLLTEALRGEGAVLMDEHGRRFMAAIHRDAELAPRDVVARAIWRQLREGHRVYLDARRAVGERFPERFPTVFALCRRHGLDPRREPMPVVPAAHYHMGGVAVDANGRTSLPGLWACGEVAATGAHGANRLASNSLLEALVFGARVAEDVRGGGGARDGCGPARLAGSAGAGGPRCGHLADGWLAESRGAGDRHRDARRAAAAWVRRHSRPPAAAGVSAGAAAALIARVRRLMWERVGVERDAAGLASAVVELRGLMRSLAQAPIAGAGPADALAAGGPGWDRAAELGGPGWDRAADGPARDGASRSPDAASAATDGSPWLAGEARNLLWAGQLLAQAALAREESRGGHYRADHPRADAAWQRRLFLTVTPGVLARFERWPAPAGEAGAAMGAAAAASPSPASPTPCDSPEPAPLPLERLA